VVEKSTSWKLMSPWPGATSRKTMLLAAAHSPSAVRACAFSASENSWKVAAVPAVKPSTG